MLQEQRLSPHDALHVGRPAVLGRHEHARLRAGPRQNSLLLGRTMAISIFELLFPTIYMDNAIIIALLDTETTYFLRRPFPD